MNILIIENEIYLAQSIASKLSDLSHNCDISSSTKEGLRGIAYDVVLLSTNISGQDIYPVIEAYKNAVVILMVSYVSNDTVSKPLAAGAKDYILKPFMIEELIRKINHYQDYEKLKKRNEAYDKYLTHTFSSLSGEHNFDNLELPVFISSSYQKHADSFAFEYAKKKNLPLHFITLSDIKAMSEIESITENSLIYIIDLQILKKSERKALYALLGNKKAIVCSTDKIEDDEYEIIDIKSESNIFDQGEILPIEDYVKYIVLNYQHKFPDTELSKKLGIS